MTARIVVAAAAGADPRALAARLRAEYLTVAVAAGEVATLDMVADWRPDLIVLDAAPAIGRRIGSTIVPDAPDLAFCARLRTEPCSRHVPLLLLVLGDDPALRLRGLELGADDVLAGPPDMDLLLARLHALVRAAWSRDAWRGGEAVAAPGAQDHGSGRAAALPAEWPLLDAATPGAVTGARALVVDDDDLAAERVQDWLARDGIVPGRAATAAQVAAMCAAMRFDLILLSLALLTDDPLRIAAMLRAGAGTRHVPLLMLSSPALRPRSLRGFALGADDSWEQSSRAAAGPASIGEELRARARNLLRRKFRQDRLLADVGQAFEVALTDPLTGCYNQRYLGRLLRRVLEAAAGPGVAVLLLDIDQFRDFNERFGYAAGDAALVRLAAMLRQTIRALDSLVRSGGEEFVVIMPGCAAQAAAAAAEQLRGAVAVLQPLAEPQPGPLGASGERCQLTVSIGVAATGGRTLPPSGLLHLAELALAQARERGGNCVAAAPAGAAPELAPELAPEPPAEPSPDLSPELAAT